MERWSGDNRGVDILRIQLRRIREDRRDAITFRQSFGAVHGLIHERDQLDAFVACEYGEMKRLRDGTAPDKGDAYDTRSDRSRGI